MEVAGEQGSALRASWTVPDADAVSRVDQLLRADETFCLAITAVRRYTEGGRELVLALSQHRRLARSTVLRSTTGNPRALTVLAACLGPAGAARPLRALERILMDHAEGGGVRSGIGSFGRAGGSLAVATAGGGPRNTSDASAGDAAAARASAAAAAKCGDGADGDGAPSAPSPADEPPTPAVRQALRTIRDLKKRIPREASPPPPTIRSHGTSVSAPPFLFAWLPSVASSDAPPQSRTAVRQLAAAVLGATLVAALYSRSAPHLAAMRGPPPPPPPMLPWLLSSLSLTSLGAEQRPSMAAHAAEDGSGLILLSVACAAFALLLLAHEPRRAQPSDGAATAASAPQTAFGSRGARSDSLRRRFSSGSFSAQHVSSAHGEEGGPSRSNSSVAQRRPSSSGAPSGGGAVGQQAVGSGPGGGHPLQNWEPPVLSVAVPGQHWQEQPALPPPPSVLQQALLLPRPVQASPPEQGSLLQLRANPPLPLARTHSSPLKQSHHATPSPIRRIQTAYVPSHRQLGAAADLPQAAPSAATLPRAETPPSTLLQQLTSVFTSAGAEAADAVAFAPHIMPSLKPRIVEAGEVIVRAGDEGDEMYFITDGTVEIVSSTGVNLYATKGSGDFFGEVTCLQCAVAGSDHDTPRKRRIATVRASARCMLWSLRSADLLPALAAFPRVRVALIDTANSRLSQTCAMLAARLGTLLTDVIPDESRGSFFSQLAPCMRPLAASAGDILIRQGEVNDDLFFLCEGEVCTYLSACPSPSLAVGPRGCTAPQLRPTPLRSCRMHA